MSLFLESLNYQDGQFPLIMYHQERMTKTLEDHNLPVLSLYDLVESVMPLPGQGKYKVRVLYGDDVPTVSYEIYSPVGTQYLKVVHDDTIAYRYKYANREALTALFAQRGTGDNVLIVKGGMVTDTAYTNVILFDGTQWVTPRIPLLCGVMRAKLLKERRIVERDIHEVELSKYQEIRLINALNSLDDSVQAFIREK